jgi:hypothetical protein
LGAHKSFACVCARRHRHFVVRRARDSTRRARPIQRGAHARFNDRHHQFSGDSGRCPSQYRRPWPGSTAARPLHRSVAGHSDPRVARVRTGKGPRRRAFVRACAGVRGSQARALTGPVGAAPSQATRPHRRRAACEGHRLPPRSHEATRCARVHECTCATRTAMTRMAMARMAMARMAMTRIGRGRKCPATHAMCISCHEGYMQMDVSTLYACVYIHTYTYIHTYIHTYIYICAVHSTL